MKSLYDDAANYGRETADRVEPADPLKEARLNARRARRAALQTAGSQTKTQEHPVPGESTTGVN